jgi:hypothetical protein
MKRLACCAIAAVTGAGVAFAQSPLDADVVECGTREQVATSLVFECAFGVINDGKVEVLFSTNPEHVAQSYHLTDAGPGQRPEVWIIGDLDGRFLLLEYETAENGNLTSARAIIVAQKR